MKKQFLILIGFFLFTNSFGESLPPVHTVPSVDLTRYLGKWYEIARFDQRFQKNCTAVTATYSLRDSGKIDVLNECYLGSPKGEYKKAKGIARVTEGSNNAKLRVTFLPRFLRWLPIGVGDYWVIDLDDKDYSYAVVGDPSRDYLWILSRTPHLDKVILQGILDRLENDQHYDTSKLLYTEQP